MSLTLRLQNVKYLGVNLIKDVTDAKRYRPHNINHDAALREIVFKVGWEDR
jgi:hypothetical protein